MDLVGIDIDERSVYWMDMREFLLKKYNFMIFLLLGIYENSLVIV